MCPHCQAAHLKESRHFQFKLQIVTGGKRECEKYGLWLLSNVLVWTTVWAFLQATEIYLNSCFLELLQTVQGNGGCSWNSLKRTLLHWNFGQTYIKQTFLSVQGIKCHCSARYVSLSFRQVFVSIILALLWRFLRFWVLEANSAVFVKMCLALFILVDRRSGCVWRSITVDFLISKNKKLHI